MATPKITGYRELSEADIEMINCVKAKAEEVRELLVEIGSHVAWTQDPPVTVDGRWLSIGKTDLQKGFMAVIRAIARPETF